MTAFVMQFRDHVVNVKRDYGAIGGGVLDDRPQLQAAIDAAQAMVGGGECGFGAAVFCPSGKYRISAPLVGNRTRGAIGLYGSGRGCTEIVGNFPGFIIEKPDDNTQNFEVIDGLSITNERQNTDSGALHLSGCIFNVRNCRIVGAIGVKCEDNVFGSSLRDCQIVSSFPYPNAPGTIGIACQQVGLYDCRFQLFETAIAFSNATPTAIGCIAEVCGTGLALGVSMPAAGNDLWNSAVPYAANNLVIYPDSEGAEYASIQNSNTNHLPTDTSWWSPAPNVTRWDAVSGAGIVGFQTERCDTGISIIQASGFKISGGCITGTAGTWKRTSSITWAAGVATLNTAEPLSTWLPNGTTTFWVQVNSATHSGYNMAPGAFVLATVVGTVVGGSTSFTYAVASDPGGSEGNATATWSRIIQYGIRMRGAAFGEISGLVISASAEVAKLDMNYDGLSSFQAVVLAGINAGSSVILPRGPAKAGIRCVNCDFTLPMVYADLPGESTVTVTTALEGMEYDIINAGYDGTIANGFLAVASGGGTGAGAHRRVRYNAAVPAWQIVG